MTRIKKNNTQYTNTHALLIVLDVDDNDVYKVQTTEAFNT